MNNLLLIVVGSVLVNNFVMSQFLGICPFLGVSKKSETALGMGLAVTFVMTIASFFTYIIENYLLIPLHLEFMQTIAFILVIAALVAMVWCSAYGYTVERWPTSPCAGHPGWPR